MLPEAGGNAVWAAFSANVLRKGPCGVSPCEACADRWPSAQGQGAPRKPSRAGIRRCIKKIMHELFLMYLGEPKTIAAPRLQQ